ncbi:MAG TPA: hypothetical protein PKI36_09390 [Turneriella sp.]|nr:hypothetical protein [Turneriella sp.]
MKKMITAMVITLFGLMSIGCADKRDITANAIMICEAVYKTQPDMKKDCTKLHIVKTRINLGSIPVEGMCPPEKPRYTLEEKENKLYVTCE